MQSISLKMTILNAFFENRGNVIGSNGIGAPRSLQLGSYYR